MSNRSNTRRNQTHHARNTVKNRASIRDPADDSFLNYNNIRMNQESQKDINQRIFKKLDHLKDRIEIFADVYDTYFSIIDDKINTIYKKLETHNEHMNTMQKYTKLESDFQETQNTTFISKLYLQHYPFHRVDTIHVTKCFLPNGKEITDFDGLLLARNDPPPIRFNNHTQRNIKNRWNMMHTHHSTSSRALNQLLQSVPSRKNANIKFHSKHQTLHYLVIESKHALSKGKVDKKMKQIAQIHDVLRNASTVSSNVEKYKTMIHQWLSDTHLPIDQLDHPIRLILSSDDISDSLIEYITTIHDGITEEAYDRIVHNILFTDPYMVEVIEMMMSGLKIHQKSKALHHIKTRSMHEIRGILLGDVFAEKRKAHVYILDYITPFSELEETFQRMQHHIGVLKMNHVYFSSLFSEPELSSI
jgi:hypothetical protein